MYTTVLTVADLRAIVHRIDLDSLMDETISRLEDAFAAFDPEKVVVPARDGFQYNSPQTGLLEWMPGMRVGERAHIKVVGYHPDNAEHHDLPTILSTLSMYGLRDGHLMGLMDATFITALRTGAASAVASRLLAPAESSTLGMIGCGTQAVTQLHALTRVFDIKKVYVYDTDPGAMKSLGERIRYLRLDGLEIEQMPPTRFLPALDVLCTATSVRIGEGPVFEDGATRSHLHVNAVGSDFPGKTEVPRRLLRRSLVCPDFAAQAIKEGECQQLGIGEVGPDLHTLVKEPSGTAAARQRTTVFDSTGWALEDMVCMEMFMEHAEAYGIGQFLQLESISSDCRNPYQFLFDEKQVGADNGGTAVADRLLRVV